MRPGLACTPEVGPIHPDFTSEQSYIDHAYDELARAQLKATELHGMVESGRGGTHQARFERDVISDQVTKRVAQLDIGDASLVFGRIDQSEESGGESFYIGRVAVWDDHQDPVTVDWRAPVAESFYRATGRETMGLVRRRHFASRGRTLLGIEDEFFGDGSYEEVDGPLLKGRETLAVTMEQARTGRLGDIIATIQGEQDEVIRAPLPGILVVQGGPGTGKTVVALHRAAYLLYTHRFPLEGQGVLVVGPSRVFLTYIEQVLPSLGEAGVQLAVLPDLIPRVWVRGFDAEATARVKGDPAISHVLRRSVRDRERPLRSDLVIGHGLERLRVTVDQSAAIVTEARRRYNKHNSARSYVRDELFRALAASSRSEDVDWVGLRDRIGKTMEIREVLEWMWPVLSADHLVHDLYGSHALLRSAARGELSRADTDLLYRPRSRHVSDVIWTSHDVPVLDEARSVLGPRPAHRAEDAIRTYGHIVVDEAQDLSPMQLRMLRRRSLNGSMTLVGDIAQATGAWASDDWVTVTDELPQRKPPRFAQLTVGYRLPQPTMDVAARVLRHAAPQLDPPVAVRVDGDPPRFLDVDQPARLPAAVVAVVRSELEEIGHGNLAVIAPDAMVDGISDVLAVNGVDHGLIYDGALSHRVTVVPVGLVKGLELDAAVVVEPARIVADERNGLRALYVAITRATRRLTILHAEALPACLADE